MSRLSPVNQARWARFRHNRRGYWSLWIFAVLFALSMCSELIANDKPLLVHFKDRWYVPVLTTYSESDFGGRLRRQPVPDHGYVNRSRSTAGLSGRRFVLARTVLTSPRPPLPFAAFRAKLAGNGRQRRRCAGAHPLWHPHLAPVWAAADAL